MLNNETSSALRYTLADLYPTLEDSRRIVADAGIPAAQVAFNAKSINNWYEILRVSEIQDKTQNLILAALKDYPNNAILKQISEFGELSSTSAPNVGSDLPWRQGDVPVDGFEKIMGKESTLLPVSFLELGIERSRSVARVRLHNGLLGSGFLTRNNLFITNNHVLKTAEDAEKATLQFNYQKSVEGLDLEVHNFELDTEIFATSKYDDWTIVKVKGDANKEFGAIDLIQIDDYEQIKYLNIIQHPSGGPKQIGLYHNLVVYADQNRIQYLTDTLPGSSGSPVFDDRWRVIALHHSGGWITEPNTKRNVFRNEGININLVVAAIEKNKR